MNYAVTSLVYLYPILCFRVTDLADLVPQINPDGSGRILKPEFRNVLNRLGYYMEDVEFDKLWEK